MSRLRTLPMYVAASTLALIGFALLVLLPGRVGYFACCIEVHPSGLPMALLLLLIAVGLFAKRRTAQLGAIAMSVALVVTTVAGNLTWANVLWGVLVQSIWTVALLLPGGGHWRPVKLGVAEYLGVGLAVAFVALAVLVPGYHW